MSEKSPENYPLITYAWVILMSVLGGVVSFMRRVKGTRTWGRFVTDIITAIFCGLVTFYLCEWFGLEQVAAAAFCSIAGNMGGQAIHVFKQMFVEFFSFWKSK